MKILWAVFLLAFLLKHASALTEDEIQGYLDAAVKAGGGEVVIPPGVHLLKKGLTLKDAKKIRLIGLDAERCVLKLPPIAYAKVRADASIGADQIQASSLQNIVSGMRLRIEAPSEKTPPLLVFVHSIEGDTIRLRDPLKLTVAKGALMRDADASPVIDIQGASEDITVEKLCMDGGRVPTDPDISRPRQLCGIRVAGSYAPETVPKGPRIQNVRILRCIFQNFHGRGVAYESANGGGLEDCTLMDISDEAVDLGHFSENITVRHNDFNRCRVGVALHDTKDCLVTANEIHQSETGLHLSGGSKITGWSEGNQIRNNLIDQTRGDAIQLGADTARNTVRENEIINSGKNGIVIDGTDQTVEGNSITGSALKDIDKDQ